MRYTFFDYYKMILEKVSFDYHLFQKEYRKAMDILSPDEAKKLKDWINTSKVLVHARTE